MFAQSLLKGDERIDEEAETRKRSASYSGQLFLTVVGAIFLSMSVAPTEEVYLISYQMTYWHLLALIIITLMMMHAFIHAVEQRGLVKGVSKQTPFWSLFFRYSVTSYAIVLLISFYILWTFGSLDNMAIAEKIKVAVVLGFPAAIGGSASRLIL